MKAKIKQRRRAGYRTPVFSWRCNMCNDFVILPDLDGAWVVGTVKRHLSTYHLVDLDRIKIKIKFKKE